MSWTLAAWLLLFMMQAGLLGRAMYSLLCLGDLEQDHINPYDLSSRLNRFVVLELVLQVAALLVTAAAGFWFTLLLQAGLTGYLVHQHMRRQVYIDATDAFKQLRPQQQWRMKLFGGHCVAFVLVTYRLVEKAIHTVLTPEGREIAKKIFREAAGNTIPGY